MTMNGNTDFIQIDKLITCLKSDHLMESRTSHQDFQHIEKSGNEIIVGRFKKERNSLTYKNIYQN